jgi:cell division protein FtsN
MAAAASTPASAVNGTLAGDEPRKIRTVSVKGDQNDAAANPAAKPAATRSMPAAPMRTAQPVSANANASTNAPMPIAPAPAAAPARMVSANPAPQPITPVAVTSSGGYLVQVSSQTSEADAQRSFKSMQGKYPDLLGTREPTIKQAEVGGKTVYRAMVGPFASSGEANQFCSGLKTAGGQCFVPRN